MAGALRTLRKRQKRETLPRPAVRPSLPPVRDVDLDWVIQLSVRCEYACPGFLDDICLGGSTRKLELLNTEQQQIKYGTADNQVLRDLVMSGRSSAFDLTTAIVCAFGLETMDMASTEFPQRSNSGCLQQAGGGAGSVRGGPVSVSLSDGIPGRRGEAPQSGSISGVTYADETGRVSARELKSLYLAQLLDRPRASSSTRHCDEGLRDGVCLSLVVPERMRGGEQDGSPRMRTGRPWTTETFVPRATVRREMQRLRCDLWWMERACFRATGGMGLPSELVERILTAAHDALCLARQCYYAFHVRVVAIGKAGDSLFPVQNVPLARCVAARGGCYGGTLINYDPPALGEAVHVARMDELNARFFPAFALADCRVRLAGREASQMWLLRTPLFRLVEDVESEEDVDGKRILATSYRDVLLSPPVGGFVYALNRVPPSALLQYADELLP